MAITSVSQLNFVVTTEAEKSTAWSEGSQVYVTDTQQSYVLQGGEFINITQISSIQGTVYTQALHYSLI